MNTPIISPIWFYMMDVARTVDFFSGVVMVVTAICFIALCASEEVNSDIDYQKAFKYIIISLSVSGFLFTIIQSRDTMMKMLVAQNITYERVEGGKEMVKDTVDYIFEKIDENKKGE